MNYTFAVDSEKLKEVSDDLEKGAEKIRQYQEEIYSIINSMSSEGFWTGETYEKFKTQCESYKPAIEGLRYLLLAFKQHFSKLDDSAVLLSKDISSIINSKS